MNNKEHRLRQQQLREALACLGDSARYNKQVADMLIALSRNRAYRFPADARSELHHIIRHPLVALAVLIGFAIQALRRLAQWFLRKTAP